VHILITTKIKCQGKITDKIFCKKSSFDVFYQSFFRMDSPGEKLLNEVVTIIAKKGAAISFCSPQKQYPINEEMKG
jgi:hypothetical protein